jgi:hypothetical protein
MQRVGVTNSYERVSKTPKLGYYSGLIAFIAAAGYSFVQILQVIRVVAFPLDAILIYALSLFITMPFLLSILALHYVVPNGKKIWRHAALLFSVIYVTYVTLNYVVQLATVIPASLSGTLDEVRILDQTPHSLFWNVDALGYIFLGLVTLFAFFVFKDSKEHTWLKWMLLANALVTPLISFVYFYPHFSYNLLLLGVPWIITAPGSMLLLALYFGKLMRKA